MYLSVHCLTITRLNATVNLFPVFIENDKENTIHIILVYPHSVNHYLKVVLVSCLSEELCFFKSTLFSLIESKMFVFIMMLIAESL